MVGQYKVSENIYHLTRGIASLRSYTYCHATKLTYVRMIRSLLVGSLEGKGGVIASVVS